MPINSSCVNVFWQWKRLIGFTVLRMSLNQNTFIHFLLKTSLRCRQYSYAVVSRGRMMDDQYYEKISVDFTDAVDR